MEPEENVFPFVQILTRNSFGQKGAVCDHHKRKNNNILFCAVTTTRRESVLLHQHHHAPTANMKVALVAYSTFFWTSFAHKLLHNETMHENLIEDQQLEQTNYESLRSLFSFRLTVMGTWRTTTVGVWGISCDAGGHLVLVFSAIISACCGWSGANSFCVPKVMF